MNTVCQNNNNYKTAFRVFKKIMTSFKESTLIALFKKKKATVNIKAICIREPLLWSPQLNPTSQISAMKQFSPWIQNKISVPEHCLLVTATYITAYSMDHKHHPNSEGTGRTRVRACVAVSLSGLYLLNSCLVLSSGLELSLKPLRDGCMLSPPPYRDYIKQKAFIK